jgi:hypothetical protein
MPRSKGRKLSHHGRASIGKSGRPLDRKASKLMRRVIHSGGPFAKSNVVRDTPRRTGAQKRKARKNTGIYTSR